MSDPRIVDIHLDEETLVNRSPQAAHERAVAIYDLKERSYFEPVGDWPGPFSLTLRVEDWTRLVFAVGDANNAPLTRITLPLSTLRRTIREYFGICESYYDAIKRLTPAQIETIDMARRSVHDRGAELLQKRLEDRVAMDEETSRRLFTLICVLHLRL